jgi:hypothetical protein
MMVKCPTPGCVGAACADKSYVELLELAEAGELDFFCTQCGMVYKPEAAGQREYMGKLREMIAQS